MVDETISFVNGKPRWYRTMVQPIHNENGQVAYALINATDIHDLKTAQHDLQELNRTLEERVEQRGRSTGIRTIMRQTAITLLTPTEHSS